MEEHTRNVELMNRMMSEIANVRDNGRAVKQKGGKMYTMVQDRVETLRRVSGDFYRISTDILQWDPKEAATIVVKATIRDGGGMIVATGHAEEIRGANYINESSALENCETSAIGRALAVLGIHGGEFASADEIKLAQDKRVKISGLDELKLQPSGKEKKVSVVEANLEESSKKAGGASRPNPADSKFLKDTGDKLIEQVDRIESNVPVLKKSKDLEIIEEAFATFIPLCASVDEAYEFWHKNSGVINWLKEEEPDAFTRVRDMFTQHKANISKKGS